MSVMPFNKVLFQVSCLSSRSVVVPCRFDSVILLACTGNVGGDHLGTLACDEVAAGSEE